MAPTVFLQHLRREPFVPFRFVMADGATRDVRTPDLVMVTPSTVIFGFPDPSNPGLAARFELDSLLHIVRIEPLDPIEPALIVDGMSPREDS